MLFDELEMVSAEDILRYIQANPGKRATEIAADLHLDKKLVNSLLYGKLRGSVTQDKSYKWWPKEGVHKGQPVAIQERKFDTSLGRLCRYYLECITRDDQSGLSVFASSIRIIRKSDSIEIHALVTA